jgi:hypothetical protein
MGKIWCTCRQQAIHYTEWRMNSITSQVYLFMHLVQYKYTGNKKRNLKMFSSQQRAGCHCVWHIFTKWIIKVLYVSIHKELNKISKLPWHSIYLGFARDTIKRRSLTTSISVANKLLQYFHGQSIACQLQAQQASSPTGKVNQNMCSWFQTFAVLWMLYVIFFWVIPRRLNFVCRRFGTLCSIFMGRWVWRKIIARFVNS